MLHDYFELFSKPIVQLTISDLFRMVATPMAALMICLVAALLALRLIGKVPAEMQTFKDSSPIIRYSIIGGLAFIAMTALIVML